MLANGDLVTPSGGDKHLGCLAEEATSETKACPRDAVCHKGEIICAGAEDTGASVERSADK